MLATLAWCSSRGFYTLSMPVISFTSYPPVCLEKGASSMCVEDVVMSRLTYTRVTSYLAGATPTFPASPDRLSVRICTIGSGSTQAVVAFRDESTGSFDAVINLMIARTDTGLQPFGNGADEVHYLRHGRLPTQAFNATSTGSAFTIVETFAMPALAKMIAKRLQEIQDAYPSGPATIPSTTESVQGHTKHGGSSRATSAKAKGNGYAIGTG